MEDIHLFRCSCGNENDMDINDFKSHIKEVHGITKLKGIKSLLSHVDGDTWYEFTYQWTLDNGLQFTEFFEAKRNKKFY